MKTLERNHSYKLRKRHICRDTVLLCPGCLTHWVADTTEIHFLTILEVMSLRWGCWLGCVLSLACRWLCPPLHLFTGLSVCVCGCVLICSWKDMGQAN